MRFRAGISDKQRAYQVNFAIRGLMEKEVFKIEDALAIDELPSAEESKGSTFLSTPKSTWPRPVWPSIDYDNVVGLEIKRL